MAERSAFDEDDSPAVVPQDPSSDVVMHDPFSQAVVNNEYSFAQTLAVHSGAVRSLGALRQGNLLMSGSIDFSNKMYSLNMSSGKYEFQKEVLIHEGFVMDICPLVAGTGFLSAGKDSRIVLIESLPIVRFQFPAKTHPLKKRFRRKVCKPLDSFLYR